MPTLRLGIDSSGARVGANEYNRSVDGVRTKSRQAVGAVGSVDTSLSKLSKTMRGPLSVAFGVTIASMASTVLSIRSLTGTVAGFESAMSGVRAVTGATGDSFDELTAKARELGASTKFSATEAAEGMKFLGQAGFTANEVLKASADTLALATAGSLELATAADIASNVLSGFNLAATEMARVADVMANTAASSNTNIQQLGDAMSVAAPAAAALGVSVEQTSAAIGILGNAGIQSSRAGTALRAMLTALLAPTGEATAALKSMGLTIADVDVEAQGFSGVMRNLSEGGLTLQNAVKIFGQRFATMGVILSNNIDLLEEMDQANLNSAGAAKRMADIMSDNLGGALVRVKSAFEALTLSVGDKGVSGAIRNLSEGLAITLRRLSGAEDAAAGAKDEFIAASKAIEGFGSAIAAFIALNAVAHISAIGVAVQKLTLLMLANPLGTFIVALSAAIGLLVAFRDEMVKVGGVTATVGDMVNGTWMSVKDTLKATKDVASETFSVLTDDSQFIAFKEVALDAVQSVYSAHVNALTMMGTVAKSVLNTLIREYRAFAAVVNATARSVRDLSLDPLRELPSVLRDIAASDPLGDMFAGVQRKIDDIKLRSSEAAAQRTVFTVLKEQGSELDKKLNELRSNLSNVSSAEVNSAIEDIVARLKRLDDVANSINTRGESFLSEDQLDVLGGEAEKRLKELQELASALDDIKNSTRNAGEAAKVTVSQIAPLLDTLKEENEQLNQLRVALEKGGIAYKEVEARIEAQQLAKAESIELTEAELNQLTKQILANNNLAEAVQALYDVKYDPAKTDKYLKDLQVENESMNALINAYNHGSGSIAKTEAALAKANEQIAIANALRENGLTLMSEEGRQLAFIVRENIRVGQSLEDAKEGFEVFKKTRTHVENLNSELERLKELLDKEAISLDTYNRGVSQAQKEFEKLSRTELDIFSEKAANNVQDIFADFFRNTEDGFKGLGKSFGRLVADMLAQAAAAQLTRALFGNAKGSAEGASDGLLSGAIGALGGFLGFKDSGGYIPKGSFAIAGERRPEIVTGPANIISGAETSKMLSGGKQNFTFYLPGITNAKEARESRAALEKSAADAMRKAQRYS